MQTIWRFCKGLEVQSILKPSHSIFQLNDSINIRFLPNAYPSVPLVHVVKQKPKATYTFIKIVIYPFGSRSVADTTMTSTPKSLPDEDIAAPTNGILEAVSVQAKAESIAANKASVRTKINVVLETFRGLGTTRYGQLAKAINKAWRLAHAAEILALSHLELSSFAWNAFSQSLDDKDDPLPRQASMAAFRSALLQLIDVRTRADIVMGEISATKEERLELRKVVGSVTKLLFVAYSRLERRGIL